MRQHLTILLLIVAGILFFLQLIYSSVYFPPAAVWNAVWQADKGSAISQIVWQSRLPSAITASLAGAALGISGLCMQAIFRNPLAGPYVLGISSGSSLGVALLVLGAGKWGLQSLSSHPAGLLFSALTGAILTFALVYVIWTKIQQSVGMLIIGIMLSGFIQSGIDILQASATSESLQNFVSWSFGSFSHSRLSDCLWLGLVVIVGCAVVSQMSRGMNLILLGDQQAASAGLPAVAFKQRIALLTCLLTAAVTAFCGPIAFVGIASPHLARLLTRSAEHHRIFWPTLLTGAVLCEVCNLLQHTGILGLHIPLNSLLSLVGAPFMIWLVMKKDGHAILP
jgi:iron complex transport system permease protein